MKNKILYLIIGILIGAIATTTAFLIYNKTLPKDFNQPEMMQMNENQKKDFPSNRNMGEPDERINQKGGTSPKIPSSSNNDNI